MKKKLFCLLCALMLLVLQIPALSPVLAEEDEDFDVEEEEWFDDDDFFFDEDEDEGETEFEDEEDGGFNILTDSYTANDFAGPEAIQTETCGDFVYTLDENGGACTLSYTGHDRNVKVPSELNGHPVVQIGEHTFNFREDIESVEMPSGITAIGNMAFFKCSHLQSVTIPDGVTLLDQSCFGGCEELQSVDVPDSVETVGDFAFLSCGKLSEIEFSDQLKSIGQGAFQLCTGLRKITLPSTTEVGTDAFTDCPSDLQVVNVT